MNLLASRGFCLASPIARGDRVPAQRDQPLEIATDSYSTLDPIPASCWPPLSPPRCSRALRQSARLSGLAIVEHPSYRAFASCHSDDDDDDDDAALWHSAHTHNASSRPQCCVAVESLGHHDAQHRVWRRAANHHRRSVRCSNTVAR